MNISQENIDALNAVITLTVNKEDYATRVEDVLKDYRKRVNMPGFRPGKVPAGVVKKMYGKAVLAEEVNKLVSEKLHAHITDNNLDLLGEPLPSEKQQMIDFDTTENFEFVFDVALAPEVDVKLSKRDKLPMYTIAITDEMVKQQADSITGRFGTTEKVDVVGAESMVKGDFVQVDKDGAVVEGGIFAEDTVLSVRIMKDKKEQAKLLNAKAGDVVVLDPKKAFPNDSELSYLLKITKEEVADVKGNFQLTIKEVTEFKMPELNQELFDKAFGPGVVASEEEFNAKVKADLADALSMESDYRFTVDAKDKLMSKVSVDFPEAFLKRWVMATNRENEKLDEATLEAEMPKMLEDLKWQLIKNNIIKSNELKVEDADVLNYAKQSARMQFMQYGLNNVPDEHLANYAQEMLKQEQQRRQIVEGAISEKVMSFVKEAVKLEDKELSRDEFNKLFENN